MAGPADSASLATADAGRLLAPSRLRECRDCGQFQLVPALPPGTRALCLRCDAVLRHTHHDPLWTPLALNLTGLLVFLIAVGSVLMLASAAGRVRVADLFSGPEGLEQHGMWELAAIVLFTTVAAPAAKLGSMLYVLVGLRLPRPPRHIRTVFAWVEHLRPWSMIEVYMLGVFVAYVRLNASLYIEVGVAIYALFALIVIMIAADTRLDAQFVWEEMERLGVPDRVVQHPAAAAAIASRDLISCHTCGLVCRAADDQSYCPRCGFRLHVRKPDSVARTAALCIAAAILYLPANVYPVLTVVQLGAGDPSTILGGVRELIASNQWPLAAVVFFASILVPVLKLVSFAVLLTSIQRRHQKHLRDRTVLYRIIDFIGRWSMIDIFMGSILVALVQFGALLTITPGFGAVAFAAVVILTMFAARTFDPRLMWDAAEAARV